MFQWKKNEKNYINIMCFSYLFTCCYKVNFDGILIIKWKLLFPQTICWCKVFGTSHVMKLHRIPIKMFDDCNSQWHSRCCLTFFLCRNFWAQILNWILKTNNKVTYQPFTKQEKIKVNEFTYMQYNLWNCMFGSSFVKYVLI